MARNAKDSGSNCLARTQRKASTATHFDISKQHRYTMPLNVAGHEIALKAWQRRKVETRGKYVSVGMAVYGPGEPGNV